ncbi:3'-5' exonuclease [Blastocladiella emersonii ATCC 22665]|nr:3'-5' exonuclease [Blastocladiella emersonii ATCC 22665]
MSSNWKKLQAKLKTEAPTVSAEKTAKQQAEAAAAAEAVARAVAAVAASSAAETAESEEPAADGVDPDRHGGSDDDDRSDGDDEGEDLFDALAKGKAGDLPTHSMTTAATRIPVSFRPAEGEVIPTTIAGWFDYLDAKEGSLGDKTKAGKYVALDCEMVGVGPEGAESALARVSVVNYHGHVLLDTFVQPGETVTDYRTAFSGITPQLLVGAPSFKSVVKKVAEILKDNRILVGHSLRNDFDALLFEHPKHLVRDTARYTPIQTDLRTNSPSLRRLAEHYLGLTIQSGSHDSVEDARTTMLVFRVHKDEWEQYLTKLNKGEIKLAMNSKRKKSAAHWDRVRTGGAKRRRTGEDGQGEGAANSGASSAAPKRQHRGGRGGRGGNNRKPIGGK